VSGENEVVLEAEYAKMLLTFSSDVSTFETTDWDGEEAEGKRVAG